MTAKPLGSFLDPLDIQYIDGIKWELTTGFSYQPSTGPEITVPSGFITDFASIPQIFWNILPPTGPEYGKAAVIHDFLYSGGMKGQFTRAQADQTFADAMKVLGVPAWKRVVMYDAVRAFGASRWKG